MCQRYSWIEKDDHVLFLTSHDVFDTERGEELQRHTRCRDDYVGHGALRWFFDVQQGADRECSGFLSSDNFPLDLANAIRAGDMWRLGITPEMAKTLLTPDAAMQLAVQCPICADYNEAVAAYYVAACDGAVAAYYEAVAAYDGAVAAYYEAVAAHDEAVAAYYEAVAAYTWDPPLIDCFAHLWANPENRVKVWQ